MSGNVLPMVQSDEFTFITCGECGIRWAVPEHWRKNRQETGKDFYCPNGHCRVYREPDIQRLERELKVARERADREAMWKERARERADALERSRNAVRGVVTRMRKRLGAGCCPACKRHFANLQAHMETKHPKFGDGDPDRA